MDRGDRPEDLRVAVLFLRALRGWDQRELADAAGLSPSSISRYESGELVPSSQALEQIALAVGIPPPMLRRVHHWIRAARATVESTDALDDDVQRVHALASGIS